MKEVQPQRLTLTVEEAGKLLGIGRSAAYLAVHRGELPTIKIGRKILVPRQRLDNLLNGDVPNTPRIAE